jgi:hypothetical protein
LCAQVIAACPLRITPLKAEEVMFDGFLELLDGIIAEY